MPTGVGTWPAFWAMGDDDQVEWPAVGEIDAMEYVGRDRSHVIGTVHGATDDERARAALLGRQPTSAAMSTMR